jgi:hypothetical protein
VSRTAPPGTWALLITYQAIRALICHAAGAGPGRLSFTTALHAARRTLGPGTTALQAAGDEILASLLPGRPPRTCALVLVLVLALALAEPQRAYPSRKGKPQPLPQRIHCTVTITTTRKTARTAGPFGMYPTNRAATRSRAPAARA